MSFWCFLCASAATRGQYLAFGKAWWSCCRCGRSGGVCYHGCDGRIVITNVSSESGALGSLHGSAVDQAIASRHHHVYCLWILTAYYSWVDYHTVRPKPSSQDNADAVVLTIPKNNINTTCLRVRLPRFLQ